MAAVLPLALRDPIRARAQTRPWRAFGSAVCVEALLVGAVVAWVFAHPPQAPDTVVPLTIELPPPPEPPKDLPKPPEPPPVPARPLPPVANLAPRAVVPPPVAPVQTPPPVQPAPSLAPAPAPAPEPAPAPAVAPAPAPVAAVAPAPPPAAPAAPAVDPAIAYNAKLAAAVQAVYQVPSTATDLEFRGRTRVEFSLRDGLVTNVKIAQSSGLGAADRAALKAVQSAAFPPPPAALQGRESPYVIWVNCRL